MRGREAAVQDWEEGKERESRGYPCRRLHLIDMHHTISTTTTSTTTTATTTSSPSPHDFHVLNVMQI